MLMRSVSETGNVFFENCTNMKKILEERFIKGDRNSKKKNTQGDSLRNKVNVELGGVEPGSVRCIGRG